jgi:aminocarboxymuconate-semialdehyde decarboxylase
MFSLAERYGILLFLHPVSAEPPSRFPVYALQLVVQWPAETSFAVARMIFGGFFERFPRLKLLLAHGGGAVLFLKGRLNSAYEARGAEADPYFTTKIEKPPGDYLGQLYFDTCSQSLESVEFTIRLAGPDRVMFGTDYPFEIGDAEGAQALPALASLPPGVRQKIFHDNAAAVWTRCTARRRRARDERRQRRAPSPAERTPPSMARQRRLRPPAPRCRSILGRNW